MRTTHRHGHTEYPIPGQHIIYDESQTIDLDNVPVNGGILVKILALSIDPYLRRMMVDPKIPSNFVSPTPKTSSPRVQ